MGATIAYGERPGGGGSALKVPFVDLRIQYESISEEVEKEIRSVMERCDFILGEKVRAFEKDFGGFIGVKNALGVASGTDALHLALRALGIKEGDEVITQANTFIATLLAITYAGAKPVLVDIDPETFNMDPGRLEEAVTERTKAIIPVHIYGKSADMDPIMDLARSYGLHVVEDACQAHGAFYYGRNGKRRVGSIGEISAFSFYPGKNLGAYGDGGMVATDRDDLAERIKMLRDYGQSVKYHHLLRGFNSRLDTIQAAVLLVKLRHLERWNRLRAENAKRYSVFLKGVSGVELPPVEGEKETGSNVFHLFVARVERRAELISYLKERNISTGIHYPIPNHLQEAFGYLGYRVGDFPVTEGHAGKILSLPMYPELTEEKIEYVADSIRRFYGSNA